MSRTLARVFGLVSRRVALNTLGVSAAIVAIVMIVDFVLNVWLMPGVTPYTPIATLAFAVLIAPPFVLALLLQTEKVRQAQQSLALEQAARISAEAVNAARSRFLANISHELRTPLNGIIGYSELMLETAEQEGRAQDVIDHGRVIGGARRLLHILNDLLDLAKVEAGRLTLNVAPFEIRHMLVEAIDLVRPDIERNRNQVRLEFDDQLTLVRSDEFRLSQCVLNLLTNAAKFTSDGAITVAARQEIVDGAAWLAISVKDTGIGIAPARQVLLFEPFMQAEMSGADPNSGSGLGLALTRQLTQLLGGSVTLESDVGKGACFTLRAPIDDPPHTASEAAAARDAA